MKCSKILFTIFTFLSGSIDVSCQDVCAKDDSICILAQLDSEERLEAAFNADAVAYKIFPEFLKPSVQEYERDVTLCTQGSIDRLDRLLEQASVWHGSLSAALYLKPSDVDGYAQEKTFDQIKSLHEKVESQKKCRLTISLLYGISLADAQSEFDTLYPINALRNVAVRAAKTELIMVIDIDFIPSDNFWEFLVEEKLYAHLMRTSVELRRVWALISLELHETYLSLPRHKSAVAECLQNRSVVVAEAYLNPAAHEPVRVQNWLVSNEETGPLDVGDGFEPFVLGARSMMPLYDERFRGYGWDKTTHAMQLVAQGGRYHLLPHHFVTARYHPPTPTAVRVFSDAPDELLRLRMEWLFARFGAELEDQQRQQASGRLPRVPRLANHTLAPEASAAAAAAAAG